MDKYIIIFYVSYVLQILMNALILVWTIVQNQPHFAEMRMAATPVNARKDFKWKTGHVKVILDPVL